MKVQYLSKKDSLHHISPSPKPRDINPMSGPSKAKVAQSVEEHQDRNKMNNDKLMTVLVNLAKKRV
eukprot:12241906-Prorocentrum_lima.AAC.1